MIRLCLVGIFQETQNRDLHEEGPAYYGMKSFLKMFFGFLTVSEDASTVYRELSPQDFFTFTIPFSMKGSTDVSDYL